jgi:amphi-Trp domain-containing protein
VPKVEFKRKARLTRQEAAERLIALGNALAGGSEIELSSGGDSVKIGVASQVQWELEIEIDGDETEIEIEIKWTDDPSGSDDDEDAAEPVADGETTPDPVGDGETTPEPASEATAPPRRGRPRKITTG